MSTTIKTEHPHVIRQEGVCGGAPCIAGTRITVRQIAMMWKGGDTPEEIAHAFPQLKASQIHDAISFYLDHQKETEEEIFENEMERVAQKFGLRRDANGCYVPQESR